MPRERWRHRPAFGCNCKLESINRQFATQMGQGMNIITGCGFVAGCVMVMNGFLNARRDENWKMTVIHGLGVAGSVALCKTWFSLFVANSGGFVSQF